MAQRLKDMNAIILAGGQSRRMGQDKAFLRLGNQSLLESIFENLHRTFAKVYVVVKNEDSYQDLGLDAIFVRDELPDQASMVGLYTGLLASDRDWNFVSAVDMPFWDSSLVERLAARIQPDSMGPALHDVILPRTGEHTAWLKGFYHRSILNRMEAAVQQGRLALHALVMQCQPVFENCQGPFMANINTPAEWEAWTA